MKDLLVAARRLVTYIEDNDTGIMSEKTGNTNVFDAQRTVMLKSLTRELKASINNNQPRAAQHLIRRCFTKPTTQRPGKHSSLSSSNRA